jgi:glycosyltransferase involved in cell wall biosynthesis/2-polyprenyl-3-methyl-5-hydroxy-6-metoxy-1,4-benzoquinol methylase
MKLAYFTPLNPQLCGISDYNEELLPYLAAHADIDLFLDGFRPSKDDLPVGRIFDYQKSPGALELLKNYDAVIYHIGNDYRFHFGTCTVLRKHPGIVVFHEYVLEDTFLGRARETQDPRPYLDELEACHGPAERARAEAFMRRGEAPPQEDSPLDFPLNQRVAQSAEGIIAHSEWCRARLEQIAPGVPTARISMPVKTINPALRRAWMQKDGLHRPLAIASFGLMTPDKGFDQTLQALSALKDEFDFHYTLVGTENPYWDVREIIIRHGLGERVTITGHVSLEEFERYIASTDLAINLRNHTVGETSASLCRIMGLGVPAVVSDIGWFSEIPDGCVIKVTPANNFSDLESRLRELISDATLRSRTGDRARDFILSEHNIWRTAERYIDFTHSVIDGRKTRSSTFSRTFSFDVPESPIPDSTAPVKAQPSSQKQVARLPPRRELRVAYFSPLNPQHSGIADYSEELLMHLRAFLDLDLFVDGFTPTNRLMLDTFTVVDYQAHPSALDRLPDYDAVLYHMGNDYRYHSGIYGAMQRHPGIVVLHDFALQDFFLGMARHQGQMSIYFDEIEGGHGRRERLKAEEHFNRGAAPLHESAPLEFPLNARMVRSADGVIVHSEWARNRLAAAAPETPITCIKHHITERAAQTLPVVKERPNGTVNIASFGLITPDKAIERVLRALAALRDQLDFHYTMIGSAANFPELPQLIRRFGLQRKVTVSGYVSLEEFQQRILETDIAINLRERPVGATSGSLCRLMAAAVPTIVSNVGAFSELPDNAVVKIDHDLFGDAVLQAYLSKLIKDSNLRRRIGRNARAYVLAEHNIEASAAKYAAFVREVIARRARTNFVRNISDEMTALGIQAHDDVMLRGVATEIATLAPAAEFATVRSHFPAAGDNGAKRQPRIADNEQRPAPQASLELEDPAESVPREIEIDEDAGRMPRVAGIDYKQGAREYTAALSTELNYYLRTKPFANLHKPIKFSGDGMDPETARHFYDFANMAVALALRADAKLLDVGCGPGWLTEYFARLGYEMTGIDISDGLIQVARERLEGLPYQVDHETPLRCRFVTHDIEAGPLEERFDAIICYDALHHFADEKSVFRNLAAMLEIGGVLFIVEGHKPPSGSPTEIELRGFMEKYKTLESPFNSDYLRALIDQNGFAIVSDYVSVNGLFERKLLTRDEEDLTLPLRSFDTDYHYFTCMKVTGRGPGSNVPDSRNPGTLRARILARTSPPETVTAGASFKLPITFINVGDTLWLTGQTVRNGLVMPGVKITDEAKKLVGENHGPLLPRAVAPGRSLTLDLLIHAPAQPGAYTVKVDLVDQKVCWFEEKGSEPLLFAIEVSEARP